METSRSNVELIDTFIDNERKSKAWTIFTVVLFSLMACLVLFFAYKLQNKTKELAVTKSRLDITQDSLQMAYDSLARYYDTLAYHAASSDQNTDNWAKMYDSLKDEYDAMAKLFNASQAQNNKSTQQTTDQLKAISRDLKIDTKVVDQVTKVVVDPKEIMKPSADFLVFMQCMPGYESKTDQVSQMLRQYKVQPKQVIKDFTFDPGVKYYKDDDKVAAEAIAKKINASSDPFFKAHPVMAKKFTLKTSYHQVEIWIGLYEKQNAKQFLEKILPTKMQKLQ